MPTWATRAIALALAVWTAAAAAPWPNPNHDLHNSNFLLNLSSDPGSFTRKCWFSAGSNKYPALMTEQLAIVQNPYPIAVDLSHCGTVWEWPSSHLLGLSGDGSVMFTVDSPNRDLYVVARDLNTGNALWNVTCIRDKFFSHEPVVLVTDTTMFMYVQDQQQNGVMLQQWKVGNGGRSTPLLLASVKLEQYATSIAVVTDGNLLLFGSETMESLPVLAAQIDQKSITLPLAFGERFLALSWSEVHQMAFIGTSRTLSHGAVYAVRIGNPLKFYPGWTANIWDCQSFVVMVDRVIAACYVEGQGDATVHSLDILSGVEQWKVTVQPPTGSRGVRIVGSATALWVISNPASYVLDPNTGNPLERGIPSLALLMAPGSNCFLSGFFCDGCSPTTQPQSFCKR